MQQLMAYQPELTSWCVATARLLHPASCIQLAHVLLPLKAAT